MVQLKRIGDVVLTTPILDCLRKKFPSVSISLAIEGSSAGLLPCIEHDEAFVFHRGNFNPGTFWKILRRPFDCVIDPTGNDRSALVAAFAHARTSVTYAKWRNRFLRTKIYSDFVESKVSHLHTADHHTALLRPLGIDATNVPARLVIPPEDEGAIAEILEKEQIQPPFVVVHPGTVKAEKFWSAQRWAFFIGELQARGLRVVLTGSPSTTEAAHIKQILASCKDAGEVCCLAGKLTLPQLAALISRASFVCGVDSAPLHFSDALGVPVLGLFGPTCPHQWRPRLPQSVVVTPKGTAPVGPEYYPGLPMEDLTADLVTEALCKLLDALSEQECAKKSVSKPAQAATLLADS